MVNNVDILQVVLDYIENESVNDHLGNCLLLIINFGNISEVKEFNEISKRYLINGYSDQATIEWKSAINSKYFPLIVEKYDEVSSKIKEVTRLIDHEKRNLYVRFFIPDDSEPTASYSYVSIYDQHHFDFNPEKIVKALYQHIKQYPDASFHILPDNPIN